MLELKKSVLITGTNRGIGLGLVQSFLDASYNVFATCRNKEKASRLLSLQNNSNSNLNIIEVDLLQKNASSQISKYLSNTPIDIFVNNAGLIGPRTQSIGSISYSTWAEVLNLNLIAPLLITQEIIENVTFGREKKLFFLSSKVGSIEDNTGGGMYIYRSSKTALNQVVKSLSIDLYSQGISSIALHPGWVQTDMGGPNALINVDESVSGMMAVMQKSDISDTGKFFNYDGTIIPW